MIVIGIDGATWDIIKPNIDSLPNIKNLMETGSNKTINLKDKPWSASVWCSMFSGKTPEEHGHHDFVKDGKIQTREDIGVEFIWEFLHKRGIEVKVLGIPFIVPPYNYNVKYTHVADGVPTQLEEIKNDLISLTEKSLEIIKKDKPDLFIVAFTTLDKICHLHWGEEIVVEMYKLIDESIGKIVDYDEELIVISDHGFCDYDKAPIQTLPKETSRGKMKGDHHPDAILITKNVDHEINQPEDVFFAIKNKFVKE